MSSSPSPRRYSELSEEEVAQKPESEPGSPTDPGRETLQISWLKLVLNATSAFFYAYAIYFIHYDKKGSLFNKSMEQCHQGFGLVRYFTYVNTISQFVSALLHILALFVKKYESIRDLAFTSLANPIGALVVFSFWGTWWIEGRENLLPISYEVFFPMWLNHVTHTMVIPVNLAQSYMTRHRFFRGGYIVGPIVMTTYTVFLLVIKWKCDRFHYIYLNNMSDQALVLYFAATVFWAAALYEIARLISKGFHSQSMRKHRDD